MEGTSVSSSRSVTRTTSSFVRRSPSLALPRVLLCDLDGTLIDTMPVLADLASEVIVEHYGLPRVLARELYVTTCGLPFIHQLESIFPGDERNALVSAIFETAKPARCSHARMPADTLAALRSLQNRGVRIALSSNNGRDNVEAFARQADFTFDLVMGYGDGLAKGATQIGLAERTFGVNRGEMLFIGDSLHDGEIAQTNRISFVGVAGTFSKDRFTLRFPGQPIVHRFSDLLGLFETPRAAVAG